MPHQIALSLIAEIEAGKSEAVKAGLGSVHGNRGKPPILPFDQLTGVHFARLFVTDPAVTLDGQPLSARLIYLANLDAPLERHLDELVERGAAGLDAVFGDCRGYPVPAARDRDSRLAFLRRHQVKSQAFYVNGIGRSVTQIRQEAELRERIEGFLDCLSPEARPSTGSEALRAAIQSFVRGEPGLAWALRPSARPSLAFRLREAVDLVLLPLVLLIFLPLLLLMAPLFLIVLRYHEERDVPDRSNASPKSIAAARADEDFGVQNQIIALGSFKRGLFRQLVAASILRVTDWACRHFFVHGALSGLRTIHFARWVRLDGPHRMFFVSNYDGSLESYQNDFIDKAASGLNAIFSSGDGFPPTRYLFLGGIRDEQAYKRFLPTRQVLTQVWYTAYPELSVVNVNNNARIRQDLFRNLSPQATREWLRRF